MECLHQRKTEARNVTAFIDEFGCLRGGDGYLGKDGKWRKGPFSPTFYSRIVACSSSVCEKVVTAER